jgi:adenylate kinase
MVEAEMLDETLSWYGWKNTRVLLIDISREEAFDRLTKRRICKTCEKTFPFIGKFKTLEKCDKCGGELKTRMDDSPQAINERLDFYDEEVLPVVGHYERKGILTKINGEQEIEKVFEEILEKIK